ncbi:MAG: UvrD-helicase domain-containing protein [Rhodospirillales bacterium]|jgi:DNA helicase-2/ATP-dependent DNA helicase PcrA|nr:UvrD-helicase domain-containing protein [Rhodospirillales bacterium]HJN22490.1 UvrD-helicase domain-containing protein [Rhodospirillales bacterium]
MSDPLELGNAPEPISGAGHLENLNESQLAAIEAMEGPLLMLAGAGTGKTRTLTARLAHILLSGKAHPWQVLAVTFTNKAAREMCHKVAALLRQPVEGWWISTFHALGARILRTHAEAVGLKANFTILDEDDQVRLIKQLLAARGIDAKRWPARLVLAVIQRWKDKGLTVDKAPEEEAADVAEGRVRELYAEYQERLLALNAADFGDLLLHCLSLFQARPDILQTYQRQFRYILVDEYQDTNVAQYLWLRLLAQEHKNICCVGDDDQSIYSWRGAEVGNILRFETDFPGAAVIRLERNYRSTPHILAAASGLIAHNKDRLGKTLWTDLGEGEKVRVVGVWDGQEEARMVIEEIESLQGKGCALNEIAVLVRAGFQTREFEERLITLAIPYRVFGGPRFYERQEIRDAVAYLRVIAQSEDDLAFERIVNQPKRGLGPATLGRVHELARRQGISMTIAGRRLLATDELKPRAKNTLAGLLGDFDRWRGLLDSLAPPTLVETVLGESGYLDMWRRRQTPDAPGRLENLKELAAAMAEFGGLGDFLEHVSLVMENDESPDQEKMTLMTLHGAKGLEFDTVFLPGWEEGLFPHQRALEEGGAKALEEERRLAYVGLTRARLRAIICFAASRRVHGQWQSALPSRFIDELPAEQIDFAARPGLYRGGGKFTASARRRRVQERHQEASRPPGNADDPQTGLASGQRIFHQKFGYGRITAAAGDKLEIAFEKAGTKKVMASYVKAV